LVILSVLSMVKFELSYPLDAVLELMQ